MNLDKVWPRVDKTAPNGCWIWLGTLTRGYGQVNIGGRGYRVHRLTYEALRGPIPNGLVLDHLCRNTACCNPDHLEPVTGRINVLRGVGITSVNARKTHCKNGHELTPQNTYVYPPSPRRLDRRECLTCKRALAKRQWEMIGEQKRAQRGV